jgi:glycerol kinase
MTSSHTDEVFSLPRKPYLLALDQGTSSSRAILFDADGWVLAVAQQEHPQIYPQPGWVEHDPEAIWRTQTDTARRAISQAGVVPRDIAAIGIANQRETVLLWERATGRPVANAIVWQDRRTANRCEQLRADGLEPLIREKTGLLLDPYFSATKLAWLLDNVAGARELANRGELAFGTVDTYLLWRLTGGRTHATDPSNASRTLLFNLHTLDWDEELLRLFDIPRSLLPEIRPSSGSFGETNAQLFGESIPICGVAGDQQAATFGQACLEPGTCKNTYGTGSFLLMNTGSEPKPSRHKLLTTVAWSLSTQGSTLNTSYALEGSIFVTGAAVQWLRDGLGIVRSAAETEILARSVEDCDGVYFVPAFAGLGTPYWDAEARGALVGLTRGANRAHIARAALEAACYQTRDVLDAMTADCGHSIPDLRVDGGMTVNDFLLQFQADILGIPVHRPAVTGTTALGVAYLAGLAAGVYQNTGQIAGRRRVDWTFEPKMSVDERESLYAGWKRAVARVRERAE